MSGFVRQQRDIEYSPVGAADGLEKGVLVDADSGADVALRRFTLAAGGSVPEHTNAVEHEQYVLDGEYIVGIDDTEHSVVPGDTVHIPAGTVHWYRNEGDHEVAFLCAVPAGDDTIRLAE